MSRTPNRPGDPVKGGSGYKPVHEWKIAEGEGWQHGEIPDPPDDLHDDTIDAWASWFASWWASFWTPDVVPTIRLIAKLHDAAMHGIVIYDQRSGEPRSLDTGDIGKLTALMDKFGMTPYGRKQLLWLAPSAEAEPVTPEVDDELGKKRQARKLA